MTLPGCVSCLQARSVVLGSAVLMVVVAAAATAGPRPRLEPWQVHLRERRASASASATASLGSEFYPHDTGDEFFAFINHGTNRHRHHGLVPSRDPKFMSSGNSTGVPPFAPMLDRPSINSTAGGLPFLFVHQPKNAGTSVRSALIDALLPQGSVPRPLPSNARAAQAAHASASSSEFESDDETRGAPEAEALIGSESVGLRTGAMPPSSQPGNRFRRRQLCIPKRLLCVRGTEPLAVIAGHMQYSLTTKALKHRNGLSNSTIIPCMTYIRDPVKRLVSYYYWYLQERKNPRARGVVLQHVAPTEAVKALTSTDRSRRHFFHVPLLALFGSLQPEDFVQRNLEAVAAAKERAMHSIRRCVVANTDDMAASAQMIQYYLPWLTKVLDAEVVHHENTLQSHTHPNVIFNGTSAPVDMLLAPVPPALHDAIVQSEWYRDEVDLYTFALDLHRRQLAYARQQRGQAQ